MILFEMMTSEHPYDGSFLQILDKARRKEIKKIKKEEERPELFDLYKLMVKVLF
jgi:hypothetical protein